MTGGRVVAAAAVVAIALGTGVARERLVRADGPDHDNELLYLPSGKYLRLMSVGHPGTLADAVYLWAIQHYANYERKDRYRYVEHVFTDVITELDPHYVDAYWLGALILILESQDLDAGLRLLEKGMQRNPDRWILPYLAAWECYHHRRFDRAAGYFEQAAAIPGAPPAIQRMKAGMFTKMGAYDEAVRQWTAILDDPDGDAGSREIAGRQLRELIVRRDVTLLRESVERFRKDNGRQPRSLGELVQRNYLDRVPTDPAGRAYRYDASSGRVSTDAGRVLGES